MAEEKPLKIWNFSVPVRGPLRGSAYYAEDSIWAGRKHNATPHFYAAGSSRAEIGRMLSDYLGYTPNNVERTIAEYGSPLWGKPMEGIEVERGLWVQFNNERPVCVYGEPFERTRQQSQEGSSPCP